MGLVQDAPPPPKVSTPAPADNPPTDPPPPSDSHTPPIDGSDDDRPHQEQPPKGRDEAVKVERDSGSEGEGEPLDHRLDLGGETSVKERVVEWEEGLQEGSGDGDSVSPDLDRDPPIVGSQAEPAAAVASEEGTPPAAASNSVVPSVSGSSDSWNAARQDTGVEWPEEGAASFPGTETSRSPPPTPPPREPRQWRNPPPSGGSEEYCIPFPPPRASPPPLLPGVGGPVAEGASASYYQTCLRRWCYCPLTLPAIPADTPGLDVRWRAKLAHKQGMWRADPQSGGLFDLGNIGASTPSPRGSGGGSPNAPLGEGGVGAWFSDVATSVWKGVSLSTKSVGRSVQRVASPPASYTTAFPDHHLPPPASPGAPLSARNHPKITREGTFECCCSLYHRVVGVEVRGKLAVTAAGVAFWCPGNLQNFTIPWRKVIAVQPGKWVRRCGEVVGVGVPYGFGVHPKAEGGGTRRIPGSDEGIDKLHSVLNIYSSGPGGTDFYQFYRFAISGVVEGGEGEQDPNGAAFLLVKAIRACQSHILEPADLPAPNPSD